MAPVELLFGIICRITAEFVLKQHVIWIQKANEGASTRCIICGGVLAPFQGYVLVLFLTIIPLGR
ncbi:hypothetical protein NP83_03535 [Neobacillus niacini]|nr:hypothetical protein NP83_03535 [Neobacillus niacini]